MFSVLPRLLVTVMENVMFPLRPAGMVGSNDTVVRSGPDARPASKGYTWMLLLLVPYTSDAPSIRIELVFSDMRN